MGNDGSIKRYSADELRAKRARGESRSDWEHVRNLSEADLERAIAEDPDSDPPMLEPPQGWNALVQVIAPKTPKKLMSLRLDQEVVDFFKVRGRGYQTAMNGVLLAYVRAWKLAEEERRPKRQP